MGPERIGSLALALMFILPGHVHGHLEERPDKLEMTVYSRLYEGGDRMELVVRTPLYLLTNVGLPLQGDHQVDPGAFGREDPHAPGDATYAQRATAAVLRAIEITSDGSPINFSPTDLTISSRGNTAFSDYAAAIKHVRGGLEGSDNRVDLHTGYLDLRAVAEMPDGFGQLAFKAKVGPAVARPLSITVAQISATGKLYNTRLKETFASKLSLSHLQ